MKTILIVDDDPAVRRSLIRSLAHEGFDLRPTESAEEALELFHGATRPFDLIISDVALDGMSGIEMIRRMRGAGERCPVLFITGFPGTHLASDFFEIAGMTLLPKPFTPADLRAHVRSALDGNPLP